MRLLTIFWWWTEQCTSSWPVTRTNKIWYQWYQCRFAITHSWRMRAIKMGNVPTMENTLSIPSTICLQSNQTMLAGLQVDGQVKSSSICIWIEPTIWLESVLWKCKPWFLDPSKKVSSERHPRPRQLPFLSLGRWQPFSHFVSSAAVGKRNPKSAKSRKSRSWKKLSRSRNQLKSAKLEHISFRCGLCQMHHSSSYFSYLYCRVIYRYFA